MTNVMTSILTDASVRGDTSVQALLMAEAEIAGPWADAA